jgi:hypothetical protein
MQETRQAEAVRSETKALDGEIGTMLAREAGLWMDVQRELLGSVETLVGDWLRWQRDALDASSRSMQRMYECRNLGDLIQAQQDWARDCLRWTAAQLRTADRGTSPMARKAASRFVETAAAPAGELRLAGTRPRSGTPQPEAAERAGVE